MKLHKYKSQHWGKQYQVLRGTRNFIKRHKFGFRLVSKNIWHGLPWLWQLRIQGDIEREPNCYTLFYNGKKRTIINKKRIREANKYMDSKIEGLIELSKEKALSKRNMDYFLTRVATNVNCLYNTKEKAIKRIMLKKLKRAFRNQMIHDKVSNHLYHVEFRNKYLIGEGNYEYEK